MFPSWAKNILFLLVTMISGLTLVIVIEGLISGTELLPFNTAVEAFMIQLRTPFLTDFFVVITKLGSPFLFTFAGILIAVLLFVRKNIYEAVLLVVTIGVSLVAITVLKDTLQVARPAHDLINTSGWSFPSGHATMATTFFFILSYIFFGKMKTVAGKINLVLGSILGVVLVCLSRLYLGAHWALDVLGGIALGLLAVSLTVIAFNLIFEHWRSEIKKLGL